jgi:hypothetical protein
MQEEYICKNIPKEKKKFIEKMGHKEKAYGFRVY